ncbi:unnamed protein product [Caenorhabditis angaria]|uniref:Ground-like domain-containing protein n=1 Tax=Caenorhabditis angaria TaxID=860376 RepID=A0A9P1IUI8_9PELO|nr:unnamed protein product [Caenorhabditis angaria]
MKTFIILVFLFHSSFGFFFGGNNCGCQPTPQCPPNPPCKTVAYSAKTIRFSDHQSRIPKVYNVPDELDWRAAAFGVPIDPQPQRDTLFDILHNLGDKYDSNNDQPLLITDSSTNSNYFPEENDGDLTDMKGLNQGRDIRRSPTVHVHGDIETTTIGSDGTFDDEKCSSSVLRNLMIENMSDSSAESKKNINLAAEAKFGGNVDVICSRGHFSYIFTSNLFCEASKGLTTCIAFRQSDNNDNRNNNRKKLLRRI